jgi:hypothetical protein
MTRLVGVALVLAALVSPFAAAETGSMETTDTPPSGACATDGARMGNPQAGANEGRHWCCNLGTGLWETCDLAGATVTATASVVGPDWNGGYFGVLFDALQSRWELVSDAISGYDGVIGFGNVDYLLFDTGIGGVGRRVVSLVDLNAAFGTYTTLNVGTWVRLQGDVLFGVTANITANGTTLAAATQLACTHCELATVTATNNAVKLPACPGPGLSGGQAVTIMNNDAADTAQVFPNVAGGDVGAGAGASVSIPPDDSGYCTCYGSNVWRCTVDDQL